MDGYDQRLRKRLSPVDTPGLLDPERLRFVNGTLIKFAKRHHALLLNLRLTAGWFQMTYINRVFVNRHLLGRALSRASRMRCCWRGRELTREVNFKFSILNFRGYRRRGDAHDHRILHDSLLAKREPSVNSTVIALPIARFRVVMVGGKAGSHNTIFSRRASAAALVLHHLVFIIRRG